MLQVPYGVYYTVELLKYKGQILTNNKLTLRIPGNWTNIFIQDAESEGNILDDERFMKEALRLARKAYKLHETPIGCLIVKDGEIIARGYNRRNKEKSPLEHAEIRAIRKAAKVIGDWRLEDCTMYVTLEPCPMCAGAIVQSRIERVVIGCMNPKAGCAGSVMNILGEQGFNHQAEVTEGVLREECSALMSSFFKDLREERKAEKLSRKLAELTDDLI